MGKDADILDRTVVFLQKRDGTDKLLKILRYTVKLILAANVVDSKSETCQRMKSFESSVGVSRKALRLGKFLQDVDALRKAPSLATTEGILELVSSGGEGVYYFVEQFIWLVKAGAIDKSHGPRLTRLSALFELIGYTGSVTLKAMQVASFFHKEHIILTTLEGRRRRCLASDSAASDSADPSPQGTDLSSGAEQVAPEDGSPFVREEAALRVLRFKRTMKLLSLIQDLSDSLLALADVLDEKHQPRLLRNAGFLAAAGLLSAALSAHKNWVASG